MVQSQQHSRWDGRFQPVHDPLRMGLARELREDGLTIAAIARKLELSEATVWRATRGIEPPARIVKRKRAAHQWQPVADAPHTVANGSECYCLKPERHPPATRSAG